jgi:hypothetical protein
METAMNIDLVRLLAVLGRINPAAWDAIIPHRQTPVALSGPVSRASEVELNPQPLPPKEALLLASAAVAQDIAFAAVAAEAAGTDTAARIVDRAVDDWCGTGRPRVPIPWPGPWPFPWPPDPEPHPEWDISASRVVGALSLASVASRLADGEARDALSKGSEQLLQAGLSQ